MPRSRSQLALPFALLLTAALAFLPAGWRLGWTRDLAEVVRFPLRPFTHAGIALATWLRPPPTAEGVTTEADRQLQEDRDIAERLYHSEHQRVLELEEQLRQLQQIPAETLRVAAHGVIAHITNRSPDSPLGVVELGVGGRGGERIAPGTVAVYGGVHLLGRTLDDPGRNTCALLPLASRETPAIRARIFPRDDPRLELERAPLVQLEPTGSGTFTTAIARTEVVREGDLVRLDDPSWPAAAQLMVIGTVDSIAVDDREPLRNRVVVRPEYLVQQVAYVTLIVEDRAETTAGAAPETGGAP